MRPTIDYLNARRDSTGRKGRTIFAAKTAAADDRAQHRDLDYLEQYALRHDAIQAEFQSVMRNMPSFNQMMQPLEEMEF